MDNGLCVANQADRARQYDKVTSDELLVSGWHGPLLFGRIRLDR